MLKMEYVNTFENPDSFSDFIESLPVATEREVVVLGVLGLWCGDREIMPTVCETLQSAIYKCVQKAYECIISQHGSYIHVRAYRHDGCNRFKIYFLNEKGVNAPAGADLEKSKYHETLNDYIL